MVFHVEAQVFVANTLPLRPGGHPTHWSDVEIISTHIQARILNGISKTTVEEILYNPNSVTAEGEFLFPVPKGAQLDKFTLDIDGKPVEAELLKSDKARGIYEDIVRRKKDPALLEYAGRDLFKVHVFPIEPRGKRRLVFSFTEVLKIDSGLVRYVFPLSTEKHLSKPLKQVRVDVDLEVTKPLKAIYSSSHSVEVARKDARHATVSYEAKDIRPDGDFELFFMSEASEVGATLMTYREGNSDGFFLLLASPGIDVKEERVIPKDVVFVLDTSGSMAGNKLSQAKKALEFCIENLNEDDRFELIRFSTDVDPLFKQLTDVSAASRKKAVDALKKFKPMGSTAIDVALKGALALQPGKTERPFVVIFLTDGLPTIGENKNDRIVATVRGMSSGHVRVFCFGIGTDVNTHLLDGIAEETGAQSQYVLPEEDIETKVSHFYSKIKDPVLTHPHVSIPESIGATCIHPNPLPDLFKGDQLVVVGRYKSDGKTKITLEGITHGKKQTYSFPVRFGSGDREYDFIPRLWATRRVGWLLDEIRLRGENKETKEEVIELARNYGIVTPFTSYLIVEDEARREVPESVRSMPVPAPSVVAESRVMYKGLNHTQSGDLAVRSARSSMALKSADNVNSGLAQMSAALPATTSPAVAGPASGEADDKPKARRSKRETWDKTEAVPSQQVRYAGGRSFYFNGKQWVDVRVQKLSGNKPVRIQFNSKAYFDFLGKNPQVAQWLSLGRNLQFVIQNSVYEIYE
jgi:Ca-activated chloride channel family protein